MVEPSAEEYLGGTLDRCGQVLVHAGGDARVHHLPGFVLTQSRVHPIWPAGQTLTPSSFRAVRSRLVQGQTAEYIAAATATVCRALGVVQSMGRMGSALDNAATEPFNFTLKVEFVHRHRFATRTEARIKIATWIADFYNTTGRHGGKDGLA